MVSGQVSARVRRTFPARADPAMHSHPCTHRSRSPFAFTPVPFEVRGRLAPMLLAVGAGTDEGRAARLSADSQSHNHLSSDGGAGRCGRARVATLGARGGGERYRASKPPAAPSLGNNPVHPARVDAAVRGLVGQFVGGLEDVRLARIELTLNATDDVVAQTGRHDAFQGWDQD